MSRRHSQRSLFSAHSIYLCISFLAALGASTVWSVSSVYQVEIVKLSPLQLVLVGTVMEGVTFCLQLPTGILADLYSHRLSVILGYMLMGLTYLLQGLFPSATVFLLTQISLAAGFCLVIGAEEAWVTHEMGDAEVGTIFLRGAQWGQIGSLLAVPLGLVLANLFQLSTAIITGAAILLFLSLFLLFAMPEKHFQPALEDERNTLKAMRRQLIAGGKAVRDNKMLWCVFGVTLFVALASEGMDRLSTAHFLTDFTLPDLWHLKPVTWMGLVDIGATLLVIGATEIVKRGIDTHKPRVVITILFVLHLMMIGGICMFALAGNFYGAVLAIWCARVARGVRMPLYNTWITQYTDSRQRATIFSLDGMVDPMGQIAGGPIIGLIGERISLRIAMLAVSLIMSPVLLFLGRAIGLSSIQKPAGELEKEEDNLL